MITSKKLSPERLKEIKDFPVTYDKDAPKLTADQIARMKPTHPQYSEFSSCLPSVGECKEIIVLDVASRYCKS